MNFVTCPNEDAARLVTDDRVAMLSFTGSPVVGWKLKEMCGKKKACLELGGNAGVIVHSDADLAAAVPMIAAGGFGYAGQSCISVQRIVVHEEIYDDFKTRFLQHVRDKVKAGDPRDPATVVGPMITADALRATCERIAGAIATGGRLLAGGQAHGFCLEATVLEDVPLAHEACTEEFFAPVVTLHRYGSFDDALRIVNDSRFGLQAGVFTTDLRLAMRAYELLDVGGVLINQVPTWRVENMPYGGIKDSGFGREGVRYAMEEMTELKSLIIRNG
jgi:acyl-CoA reductase-like NAD-dependent aldehyde dehydrogenase